MGELARDMAGALCMMAARMEVATSSWRTPGPITPGPRCCEEKCHTGPMIESAVWVPAFAGTTAEGVARLIALPAAQRGEHPVLHIFRGQKRHRLPLQLVGARASLRHRDQQVAVVR